MNAIKRIHECLILLLLCLVSITLTGCPATTRSSSDARQIEGLLSQTPGGADDFIIVDCRLPGKIKQLGQHMVYLSRGKSEKTTAKDCAVRGGGICHPRSV